MAPTVASWFYVDPGGSSHVIAERVRQSLWDAGLFALWLDVARDESPYCMTGNYMGDPVDMEWVPGHWLSLRSVSVTASVAALLVRALALSPSWRYVDKEGYDVWEWYLVDRGARWRQIAGNPEYQNPELLDDRL